MRVSHFSIPALRLLTISSLFLALSFGLYLIVFLLADFGAPAQAQTAPSQQLGTMEAGPSTTVAGGRQVKRLAPLRRSDVPEGSRISLVADAALNDYVAYRKDDDFYVVIPRAAAPALRDELRGRGFAGAEVSRRGDDVLLSFHLEPGATVRVNQNFNRLDVTFAVRGESNSGAAQSVESIARAEPSPTPPPTGQGEELPGRAEASVEPKTTDETEIAESPVTAALTATSTPTTSGAGGAPTSDTKFAGTLPPEKAQPVRLVRFAQAPVIDGKLDEEVWKQAAVLKDFYQTQPGDNIAPSKPTVVLLGYDAKTLYVGFHAYDEPDKVRATVAKRDNVFDDDNVRILLDTFNDQRRAYSLVFNPLGVQADGFLIEGQGEDYSVDIVMESKGSLTSDGYIVEVAIPFKSLRYFAGKDQLWGLHAFRRIKRFNNEQNSWMPISRENASFLSQEGRLIGLVDISTEHTLEVIPSLTLSETGKTTRSIPRDVRLANRSLVDPGRFINEPIKFDPGVTVKYGITPTVTLDFALNPDFAQVEADQTVVTANQRFPIFFEEKRPFFLEGIDYFQTRMTAVHTRSIVDPDVAVKLTGKRGRNTFGLLLASDNAPGNFSEEEIEDPDFTSDNLIDKNAYIGVLRLKRDIGKESNIGMIATSYNFIERHNQLGGIDGRFRLDPKTIFEFQVLGTTSNRFFFDPDLNENVYRKGNALGYSWIYDYTGRNFGYFVAGSGRTRDYRADVGFTRRVNTNLNEGAVRFSTDPDPKAKIISHRLTNYSAINYDWQGRSQNWITETQYSLTFPLQTFVQVGFNLGYERIFEDEFGARRRAGLTGAFFGEDSERSTNRRGAFFYGESLPSKKYSGSLFIGYNHGVLDLDFGGGSRFPRISPAALLDPDAPQDPGPGNALDIEATFTYQPTDAWRSSLNYIKARLVRHDTGLVAFDDNIFALRSTYQFTRFTFARARVDYDTLASSVRGQFLLGWAPNPGTSFYVGYNDDLNLN
ncbi:MAG TPA: DUF5916 domain-containing protein, partial [Pyrinomonadaceae bacterium]|nr:DUF5916 domain-containing protein [Pyrinomonadaceae bacterium]